MSSYAKWDRAAYIVRAGGQGEALRRRKAAMARQSGQRLAEERKRHGLSQAQLAQAMGVSPGRVSQIERGELSTIDAVARYIDALGGRLDLIASFGDHTFTVTTTEAGLGADFGEQDGDLGQRLLPPSQHLGVADRRRQRQEGQR
jgi:transcriptional regulator with XRE-family HTH domain